MAQDEDCKIGTVVHEQNCKVRAGGAPLCDEVVRDEAKATPRALSAMEQDVKILRDLSNRTHSEIQASRKDGMRETRSLKLTAIEKVAAILGTVRTQRQKSLVELASLATLVRELPDPSRKAWANLQEAYHVQVAEWDSEQRASSKEVPEAKVRADLDLAFSSASCALEDVEYAMEVLLAKWDNGVLGTALETALSGAIAAEAVSSARAELVEKLQVAAQEEVSVSSTRLDSSVVKPLIQECNLEDVALEARLKKALDFASKEKVNMMVSCKTDGNRSLYPSPAPQSDWQVRV
jgi:hypothetical protein